MCNRDDMQIVGLDLSLNSAGFVAMDYKTGKVEDAAYVTSMKMFADPPVVYGYRLKAHFLHPKLGATKKREAEDKDLFASRRRVYMTMIVMDFIAQVGTCRDTLVCLEGYAVDSKSPGLLEMAEISGIIRNYLWNINIPLRVHDPMSVKLWAVGNAHAKKTHMVNEARRQGLEINQDLLGDGPKFPHPIDIDGNICHRDYQGPGTDIADAFHLANMGMVEVAIRGDSSLLEQQAENRKRVLKRTTKANPLALLDKPFIVACKDDTWIGNSPTEAVEPESP